MLVSAISLVGLVVAIGFRAPTEVETLSTNDLASSRFFIPEIPNDIDSTAPSTMPSIEHLDTAGEVACRKNVTVTKSNRIFTYPNWGVLFKIDLDGFMVTKKPSSSGSYNLLRMTTGENTGFGSHIPNVDLYVSPEKTMHLQVGISLTNQRPQILTSEELQVNQIYSFSLRQNVNTFSFITPINQHTIKMQGHTFNNVQAWLSDPFIQSAGPSVELNKLCIYPTRI